jgi:predicted metalloprotease
MRWESGRRSDNVIDARGRGGKMAVGGGLGMAVLALVVYLLGGDPRVVTQTQTRPAPEAPAGGAPAKDPQSEFVRVVLGDTEDTWKALFQQRFGRAYKEPQLVLFTGAVESACGFAQAAMGPFYCPRDQRVYIDLAFYEDLRKRLGAPGDFAQAYVIAHEVGHHVQTLLGVSDQVRQAQQRGGRASANALSVRQELQADCFAGLWAHHAQRARNILEAGDVEEALGAASAVGDDRLQKRSQGYVVPESFTHGSSEQRMEWFKRGFQTGRLESCDTFRS